MQSATSRTITVTLIILFLLSGSFILLVNPKPNVELKDKPEKSTVQISPDVYPDYLSVEYPHVSTSPINKWKYIITTIKERFDLEDKKFSNLFFAAKRVREMSIWKNEILLQSEVLDLHEWWNKEKPHLLNPNSLKVYGTWEALLARYSISMTEAVKNKDIYEYSGHKDAKQLPLYVLAFEKDILLSIEESNISVEEKKYLIEHSDAIHRELYNRLQYDPKQLSDSKVPYSLHEINQMKQVGIYDLSFPFDKNIDSLPKSILIDGRNYPLYCGEKQCGAKNIFISSTDKKMYLQYSRLISQLQIKNSLNSFSYSISPQKSKQAILQITNNSGKSFFISYSNNDTEKDDGTKYIFPLTYKPKTYYIKAPYRTQELSGNIIPLNHINKDLSQYFTIVQIPQISHRILLTYIKSGLEAKTDLTIESKGFNSHLLYVSNISNFQKEKLLQNSLFWKKDLVSESESQIIVKYTSRLITICLFIFILSLLLLVVHLLLLKNNTSKRYACFLLHCEKSIDGIIKKIIKRIREIYELSHKMRIIMLIFTMVLTFFMVIFERIDTPSAMLYLFVSWFASILSYRLNSDYPFIFSYISLGIVFMCLLFQNWLLAEYFSLLSFVFFVIGILLGIAESIVFHCAKSIFAKLKY